MGNCNSCPSLLFLFLFFFLLLLFLICPYFFHERNVCNPCGSTPFSLHRCFVVRHRGRTDRLNLGAGGGEEKGRRGEGAFECYYACHYADCEHEVEMVESGYRLVLVCILFIIFPKKKKKLFLIISSPSLLLFPSHNKDLFYLLFRLPPSPLSPLCLRLLNGLSITFLPLNLSLFIILHMSIRGLIYNRWE